MRTGILDTIVRWLVLCESGQCIRIRVYVAAVAFLVRDVAFGRADADPGPEGAGVLVMTGEVDLDGEVGFGGMRVEDGTCV